MLQNIAGGRSSSPPKKERKRVTSAVIDDLIADPTWLPHALALGTGLHMRFVRVDEETLRESAFLDHRMAGGAHSVRDVEISLSDLPALAHDHEGGGYSVILHTAFCGSTLLARLLDRPGAVSALREPAVLASLADVKRTLIAKGGQNARDLTRAIFAFVMRLLVRTPPKGEIVVLKPTNLANGLATEFASHTERLLVVHGPEENFLRSVLSRGKAGRVFLRTLFATRLADEGRLTDLPERELLKLTDLQAGVLAWRDQYWALHDLLSQVAPGRGGSIDFLGASDRTRALAAVDTFLGLPEADPQHAAARGALMEKDSKTGTVFAQTQHELSQEVSAALKGAIAWAKQAGVIPESPARLPHCLLEAE